MADGPGPVSPKDFLAYIAAVTAHSGYTARFAAELTDPGVRVPITRRGDLFDEAVSIGRRVVWLWTYGERYIDEVNGRPSLENSSGLGKLRRAVEYWR
jgi:hypothetical protein